MNCQRARESFPDLLDPLRASATDVAALDQARAHLSGCPDCQREFAALSQTLAALDKLPAPLPSPRLRRDFYALLEEEKNSAASVRVAQQRRRRLTWLSWILAPVGACALLAAGFFGGTRYAAQNAVPATVPPMTVADNDTRRELQELRAKVDRIETMNQLVATSFQQQQRPANDRLHTVLTTATKQQPNEQLINELIASLALDSSPNVRLRALEALYPHAGQEVVRTAVLMSLPRESNPLVQVAMIDFLAAARDRDAKPALEKMSANELNDQDVRTAAKRALAQL